MHLFYAIIQITTHGRPQCPSVYILSLLNIWIDVVFSVAIELLNKDFKKKKNKAFFCGWDNVIMKTITLLFADLNVFKFVTSTSHLKDVFAFKIECMILKVSSCLGIFSKVLYKWKWLLFMTNSTSFLLFFLQRLFMQIRPWTRE